MTDKITDIPTLILDETQFNQMWCAGHYAHCIKQDGDKVAAISPIDFLLSANQGSCNKNLETVIAQGTQSAKTSPLSAIIVTNSMDGALIVKDELLVEGELYARPAAQKYGKDESVIASFANMIGGKPFDRSGVGETGIFGIKGKALSGAISFKCEDPDFGYKALAIAYDICSEMGPKMAVTTNLGNESLKSFHAKTVGANQGHRAVHVKGNNVWIHASVAPLLTGETSHREGVAFAVTLEKIRSHHDLHRHNNVQQDKAISKFRSALRDLSKSSGNFDPETMSAEDINKAVYERL